MSVGWGLECEEGEESCGREQYTASQLEGGNNLINNGDMHENFDHERLFKCISKKKNWFMTYNNCEYIKNLYKGFEIIETSWSYGMNKSKKSSEIVIISQATSSQCPKTLLK